MHLRRLSILLLIASFPLLVLGQKNQHNFAQSYLGVRFEAVPPWGSFPVTTEQGESAKVRTTAFLQPRIEIGGLHFWHYADFFISFPVGRVLLDDNEESNKLRYNTGINTGARFFVNRLHNNGLRPYLGFFWAVPFYQLTTTAGDGPSFVSQEVQPEGGLQWYLKNGWMLDFRAAYLPGYKKRYPLSRTEIGNIELPPWQFGLGLRKLVDFTSNYQSEGLKKHLSNVERKIREKGSMNALGAALGLSSAFTISRSDYLQKERPFLGKHLVGGINLDLGLSYYLEKLNAEPRVSYRSIRQLQEAYGLRFQSGRQSVALEGLKFFGDYHGFVPFAGAGLSADWLRVTETDGNANQSWQESSLNPILIAGWDIKPSKVEWFVLRTNLRYTPGLQVNISGQSLMADHLEVNFIQMVLYPQRLHAWRSAAKQNP